MPAADELRTSARPTASEPSPLVERLLMAGLDEYFAGRYERAIQVWSRVFFLDRNHARARAYIDRARSALAEGLREAEARGGAAPDVDGEPRSLIAAFGTDASRGAHKTLPVRGALATLPRRAPADSRLAARAARVRVRRRAIVERRIGHGVLVIVAGVLLFGAGYTVAARDRIAQWWQSSRFDDPSRASRLTGALGVRSTDDVLLHVRQLLDRGRFDEALRSLSGIRADDPRRPEADVLREEVRRAVATGAAPARRAAMPGSGVRQSR